MRIIQRFFFLFIVLASINLQAFEQESISSADSGDNYIDQLLMMRPPIRPPPRPNPPPYPPPYPPRPNPPPYPHPYPPAVTCQADDAGYEEHYGGHRNCRECLQVHGECVETCSRITETYTCNYQGIYPDGRTQMFTGFGQTQYQAEQDAVYQCRRYGLYDCRYAGCDVRRDQDVISRRSCR